MSLYLDCEFNGFNGYLISMAIVSTDGAEFYAVLPLPGLPGDIHPWVQEHVVPYLVKEPEDEATFRARLRMFLLKHQPGPIYADWPEDFVHLLEAICGPNGVRLNVELDLRLIRSGELKPEVPHNALSDARALMAWHLAQS